MSPVHRSVLLDEVDHWMAAAPGKRILDGTLGAGGHSERFLEEGAEVLGLDRDPEILCLARERLAGKGTAHLRRGNYREAGDHLAAMGWANLDGILLDLGVSSLQLDRPERGFSFREDGPLDMRMEGNEGGETAADLLNSLDEKELARLFWEYGEERFSRPIARAVVAERSERPFTRTTELAELAERVVPRSKGRKGRPGKAIHPATRIFQALRIAVNDELGALEDFLDQLPDRLGPGGRALIISFHSLEDRLVKQAFRRLALDEKDLLTGGVAREAEFEILTKRPVTASEEENALNPRARSAKLRVLRRRNAGEPKKEKSRTKDR